jgi:hypothetical protein
MALGHRWIRLSIPDAGHEPPVGTGSVPGCGRRHARRARLSRGVYDRADTPDRATGNSDRGYAMRRDARCAAVGSVAHRRGNCRVHRGVDMAADDIDCRRVRRRDISGARPSASADVRGGTPCRTCLAQSEANRAKSGSRAHVLRCDVRSSGRGRRVGRMGSMNSQRPKPNSQSLANPNAQLPTTINVGLVEV